MRFCGYPCFWFVVSNAIWFSSAEIYCRLHLASVLCSTVASDSNVKVSLPFPHRNLFDVTSPFLCPSGCEICLFSCALRSLLGNTSEMHQRRCFQVRDDLKCMKHSPCLLIEHQLIFCCFFTWTCLCRCRADFFSPPSPGHSRGLTGSGVTYESDLKALFVALACGIDSEALQQLAGDEHAIALVQAARVSCQTGP